MKNINDYISIAEIFAYAKSNDLLVSFQGTKKMKALYLSSEGSESFPIIFSPVDTPTSFYSSIFVHRSYIRRLTRVRPS